MKLGRTLQQIIDKIKKKIDTHEALKTSGYSEDVISEELSSEK